MDPGTWPSHPKLIQIMVSFLLILSFLKKLPALLPALFKASLSPTLYDSYLYNQAQCG